MMAIYTTIGMNTFSKEVFIQCKDKSYFLQSKYNTLKFEII